MLCVTEREPETAPVPAPPPPSRPRFEFRQRPSAAVAERARTVGVAWVLWLAAGALLLLAALVMIFNLDGLEAGIRTIVDTDFPAETAVTRDRAVALTLAVLIGGGIVLGLAEAGFASLMRSGRGGARFVLVLLLALSLVEIVVTLGVVITVVGLALLLSAACGLVGTVMMYLPPSNAWFAFRRQ